MKVTQNKAAHISELKECPNKRTPVFSLDHSDYYTVEYSALWCKHQVEHLQLLIISAGLQPSSKSIHWLFLTQSPQHQPYAYTGNSDGIYGFNHFALISVIYPFHPHYVDSRQSVWELQSVDSGQGVGALSSNSCPRLSQYLPLYFTDLCQMSQSDYCLPVRWLITLMDNLAVLDTRVSFHHHKKGTLSSPTSGPGKYSNWTFFF